MPLNHSQATATVTVAGLAFFRMIGQRRAKQCEVGILQCDNHTLELRIEEILLEKDGITPQRSRIIVPQFDTDKDIFIRVHDPLDAGVTAYKPRRSGRGPSNNSQKLDDPEDFRWIVNFESPDFNKGPITPAPDHEHTSKPRFFTPKIFFTNGTLYTAALTPDYFARELITNREDQRYIGQIGLRAGLDIRCGDNHKSGIELGNESGASQFLPKRPYRNKQRVRYEISIENICPFSADMMAEGSDFRLYYDAITTADHKRYDLRKVVPNGGDSHKAVQNRLDYSLDGLPQACNPAGDG
ncbi:MAG TPA: hypothetical protein VN937_18855 [Blastocatellia bacterium]|nr:hypothetical protein [Blastocatellia bacterium]